MGRKSKPYATMADGPDAYLFRKDGKQKLVGSADNEPEAGEQELDEGEGYQYRDEVDYEEDNSKIWHYGKAPGEDWEIIDRSPYAPMNKFAWDLYVDFHKEHGRWPTQKESYKLEELELEIMKRMDEDINEIRKLAGLQTLTENYRHPREATLSVIELMDEGILDPRQVADAALQYMSESEVADMARMYEWFGYGDDDDLEEDNEQMKGDDPCWDGYQMVGMKKKDGKEVPNCVPESVKEYTVEDASEIFGSLITELNEAEYQGRKVELNKPMRGDVKKFKVYVKNPKGNVVKVNFGDPDMRIKKSDPEARKSFRARHNCDNPGPKHKARYWSCRKW